MMKLIPVELIACALVSVIFAGDGHTQTTEPNLADRVQVLISEGLYDSASVAAHVALDSAIALHGSTDSSVATILHVLGWISYFQEDIAESGRHWSQCLAIRETTLGSDDPQIAEVLYALSIFYRQSDDIVSSEHAIRRAIEILDERELTHTEDYWTYERALARTLKIRQDFEGVMEIYQKVLAYEISQPDTLTESFGDILNDIACTCSEQKRYREAECFFARAAKVWGEVLPPGHPSLVTVLSSMGVMRFLMGDYERSEEYCRQADSALALAVEPMRNLASDILIVRASNLRARGNYSDAERLYLEALSIKSDVLGTQHSETALALESLGDLYMDQGRYASALDAYERSRAIYEKLLGQGNVQLTTEWNKIATVLLAMNRLDEAVLSADKALQLCQATTDPPQLLLAATMMTLAAIRVEQRNVDEALTLLGAAREIRETELGVGHPQTLRARAAHAETLMRAERLVEANQEVDEALALSIQLLNGQHALHAELLALSARIKSVLGLKRESRMSADSAWSEMQRGFLRNVSVLTERDALDYSVRLRAHTEYYLGLLLMDNNGVDTERVAEIVLSTHGQITDELVARHRSRLFRSIVEDSLRTTRHEYAKNLYSSDVDTAVRMDHLYDLAAGAKRLETQFALQSDGSDHTREARSFNPQAVLSSLAPHTALAEYFRYCSSTSSTDSTERMAILVYTWRGDLVIVDVGELDQIRHAVRNYLDHMSSARQASNSNYAEISRAVTEKLWNPIEPLLGGASTVFIAPDDCVNLVSFAGLFDSSGNYLIENYTIHYLTSAGDILRQSGKEETSVGLLVLGDPDFDMIEQNSAYLNQAVAHSGSFSERSGCIDLSHLNIPRLPYTRIEAESVSEAWSEHSSEPVKQLLGAQASETALLHELEGRRVAHLATHGFFMGQNCDSAGGETWAIRIEDPMLRCGLLVAGANRSSQFSDTVGEEDGIVPARSIANLDLRGMDIAILSACESGRGDVRVGEGVWGLRRAFELAGVRCVLSSLWKVDDRSASELVSGIFLSRSQPIASALRESALSFLAQARATGRSDHPFYWASFVASGDPDVRLQP